MALQTTCQKTRCRTLKVNTRTADAPALCWVIISHGISYVHKKRPVSQKEGIQQPVPSHKLQKLCKFPKMHWTWQGLTIWLKSCIQMRPQICLQMFCTKMTHTDIKLTEVNVSCFLVNIDDINDCYYWKDIVNSLDQDCFLKKQVINRV